MATFDRHRDPIRLLWQRLGIAGLLVVLIVVVSGVWSVWGKEQESRMLRDQAERDQKELAAQESQLRANISQLETSRGKEAALREQYNVGRAGEQMIIIVDPEQPKPMQATSTIMNWVRKFLPFW
jgi:hypothetical protein